MFISQVYFCSVNSWIQSINVIIITQFYHFTSQNTNMNSTFSMKMIQKKVARKSIHNIITCVLLKLNLYTTCCGVIFHNKSF